MKTFKRFRADRKEEKGKCDNIVIPYIMGTFEKLRRIYNKHHIPVHLKNYHHIEAETSIQITKHPGINRIIAVQCSQDCTDLYIGKTKQPLLKQMGQHRRANSSAQDSVVMIDVSGQQCEHLGQRRQMV